MVYFGGTLLNAVLNSHAPPAHPGVPLGVLGYSPAAGGEGTSGRLLATLEGSAWPRGSALALPVAPWGCRGRLWGRGSGGYTMVYPLSYTILRYITSTQAWIFDPDLRSGLTAQTVQNICSI